jgi:hypothetical protein
VNIFYDSFDRLASFFACSNNDATYFGCFTDTWVYLKYTLRPLIKLFLVELAFSFILWWEFIIETALLFVHYAKNFYRIENNLIAWKSITNLCMSFMWAPRRSSKDFLVVFLREGRRIYFGDLIKNPLSRWSP